MDKKYCWMKRGTESFNLAITYNHAVVYQQFGYTVSVRNDTNEYIPLRIYGSW